MSRVVSSLCNGCKHATCYEVCPTDSFYRLNDVVIINNDKCIDCGACEVVCQNSAIKHVAVSDEMDIYINSNVDFNQLENITN